MRAFITAVLLVLSAAPLPAQSPAEVEAVREIAAPVESVSPATSGEAQPVRLEESSAPAQGGADPVLDAGFWRSVLAGVIVAVVSTLILRLIL